MALPAEEATSDSQWKSAFPVSRESLEAAAALVAETTWTSFAPEPAVDKSLGKEATLKGKCGELAGLLGLQNEWQEPSSERDAKKGAPLV